MNIADFYDQIMFALTIWREARDEPKDTKRGVAHVILNRMRDPRWPHTAVDVVTQARQFSAFNVGDPNATKFPTIRNLLDWAAWQECCAVVDEIALDPDLTYGTNRYESAPVDERPNWALLEKQTATIGALRFYRL